MLVVARIRGILAWRRRERAFRSEGVRRLYRALRRLPASAAELSGLPEPAALQARFDGVGRGRFLGVPADGFAQSGRMQLVALVRVGLTRTSRVLDFGCGCLRGGYWLIHYLEPGCYFGIEPHAERLAIGLETLLEPGLAERKRPCFDHSPDFDLAVFGERFDFVLADSIWTHAAKPQIRRMLDSLIAASHARTTLLATYLPAGTPLGPDYQGDEWVGTSHESDVPGVIRHDLGWILEECRRRGLSARELPEPAPDSQRWIEVTRA